MELTRKSTFLSRRVFYLPADKILPNPSQPRRWFDDESLTELSRSILRYGILQPLTVRRGAQGYELIAGERRLRAARMAGLREVPCLLARADEEDSPLLALIENLQRRDLHWFEEAVAIAKLISSYGLSQEQAAEKLGKSQSAIANKLRLLRLSPECVALLREHELSERHARALLRIADDEARFAAAREDRRARLQRRADGGVCRDAAARARRHAAAAPADLRHQGRAHLPQQHPAPARRDAARGRGRRGRARGHRRGDPHDDPHPAARRNCACGGGKQLKFSQKLLLFRSDFPRKMWYADCYRFETMYATQHLHRTWGRFPA